MSNLIVCEHQRWSSGGGGWEGVINQPRRVRPCPIGQRRSGLLESMVQLSRVSGGWSAALKRASAGPDMHLSLSSLLQRKVSSSSSFAPALCRGAPRSLLHLCVGKEGGAWLESRDVGHAFSFAVNNSSLRPLHCLSSSGMAHLLQDECERSLYPQISFLLYG